MTTPTRTERRAAERKAAKLARKANQSTSQTAPLTATPAPAQAANPTANPSPISAAKLAANQANAQHSSGPRTEARKQTSSHNALKTGLTGQTVLLPTDHLPAYEALLERLQSRFKPASPEERTLVQSIIDTTWRLQRIANLDFAIFALGADELAEEFQDPDPAVQAQMIQVQTYLKYEKQLRNLHIQEARLQRLLNKETTELQRLQSDRQQIEALLAARAAKNPPPKPAAPEVGFEFENPESTDIDLANLTVAVSNSPSEHSL